MFTRGTQGASSVQQPLGQNPPPAATIVCSKLTTKPVPTLSPAEELAQCECDKIKAFMSSPEYELRLDARLGDIGRVIVELGTLTENKPFYCKLLLLKAKLLNYHAHVASKDGVDDLGPLHRDLKALISEVSSSLPTIVDETRQAELREELSYIVENSPFEKDSIRHLPRVS